MKLIEETFINHYMSVYRDGDSVQIKMTDDSKDECWVATDRCIMQSVHSFLEWNIPTNDSDGSWVPGSRKQIAFILSHAPMDIRIKDNWCGQYVFAKENLPNPKDLIESLILFLENNILIGSASWIGEEESQRLIDNLPAQENKWINQLFEWPKIEAQRKENKLRSVLTTNQKSSSMKKC